MPRLPTELLTTVHRGLALAGGEDAQLAVAAERLHRLDGVSGVEPAGAMCLRVSYDAARIAYGDIERTLAEIGLRRRQGLWWRVRAAWYRYLDENIRANARARGGACCNRPPAGGGPVS